MSTNTECMDLATQTERTVQQHVRHIAQATLAGCVRFWVFSVCDACIAEFNCIGTPEERLQLRLADMVYILPVQIRDFCADNHLTCVMCHQMTPCGKSLACFKSIAETRHHHPHRTCTLLRLS